MEVWLYGTFPILMFRSSNPQKATLHPPNRWDTLRGFRSTMTEVFTCFYDVNHLLKLFVGDCAHSLAEMVTQCLCNWYSITSIGITRITDHSSNSQKLYSASLGASSSVLLVHLGKLDWTLLTLLHSLSERTWWGSVWTLKGKDSPFANQVNLMSSRAEYWLLMWASDSVAYYRPGVELTWIKYSGYIKAPKASLIR